VVLTALHRAVDDLVEHGRHRAAVESAVEVGGADEVPRAPDYGNLVAVLARSLVREVAQAGEHREDVGLFDGGDVADGDEAVIRDPVDAPGLDLRARPAVYVETSGLWRGGGGGLGGRGGE
jgi:hypothetical protein